MHNHNHVDDLIKSGLDAETIALAQTEWRSGEEIATLTRIDLEFPDGYEIPYFGLDGKPIKHSRYRFWPNDYQGGKKPQKYVQKKGSLNRLYVPRNIDYTALMDPTKELIITEGEKKSLKACQEGYLCVGIGGVDNWMSKTVLVRGTAEVTDQEGYLRVKGDVEDIERLIEKVVPELLDIPWKNRTVYICFDSDYATNTRIQDASFELASWLAAQDAKVHIILMPPQQGGGKQGIDDYLIANPEPESLWLLDQRRAEPANIKKWIQRKLDEKATDSQIKNWARAITNAMDNRGELYRDPDSGDCYYFNKQTHELIDFAIEQESIKNWHSKPIGAFLDTEFGINPGNGQLFHQVAYRMSRRVQRTSRNVSPKVVVCTQDDALYYQLSDSSMVKVTADNIKIKPNGTDNILFKSKQIEPITLTKDNIKAALQEPEPLWFEAIRTTNLQPLPPLTLEETQLYMVSLFYLSPWFRRWRGLMLPLELVISEAGSGKTFLYNLRRAILTGRPTLDGPPDDVKDWITSLWHSPAIWICDNWGGVPKQIEDKMSNELARLITDPDPKVDARKYYTNRELIRSRIDCTFAITSIQRPFHRSDINQRSATFHLQAIEDGKKDGDWFNKRIENGGRERRLADHLVVAQRFLQAAKQHWSDSYPADNRLVHHDQCLHLLGIALKQEALMETLIPKLKVVRQEQVATSDPVIEALCIFARAVREGQASGITVGQLLKVSEIQQKLLGDREGRFTHVRALENPIKLGQYMSQHAHAILTSAGIELGSKRHGQPLYRVLPNEENKLEKT